MNALFVRVLAFAAEKHAHQQRRDSGTPYINHPIQLVYVLCEEAQIKDIDVLCAALLHDTLEDTQTTYNELVENFGQSIADVVMELTDDKALPKQVRKDLQIQRAPHKSLKAKLVGLADKICNLRDLLTHTPKTWSRERLYEYVLWAEQVVAGMQGSHGVLERICHELITTGMERWFLHPGKE